jgi:hypothetical protein
VAAHRGTGQARCEGMGELTYGDTMSNRPFLYKIGPLSTSEADQKEFTAQRPWIEHYHGADSDRGLFQLPEPLEEITADDFAAALGGGYTPTHMESRNVKMPDFKPEDRFENPTFHATIFWFYGYGVAMVRHVYGKDCIRYYRLGCKHDYKTVESRMCYWRGTCKKCGHTSAIDSSD